MTFLFNRFSSNRSQLKPPADDSCLLNSTQLNYPSYLGRNNAYSEWSKEIILEKIRNLDDKVMQT